MRRPFLLPAILLLGLALRLWVAAHVAVIASDGIARIGIARAFRDQGWDAGLQACLARGWHPLNPIAMWLMGGITGDLEKAGFAVSILGGILGILGVFLLVREAWGEREAYLAALIWALLPNAVHFSADVLTEGQFLAFWILGVWAALRALQGSWRWALAAGALGGLAYDTRVEGLGIPVGFGMALVLMAIRERAWQWKARSILMAAVLAGFLVAAFPFLLHLRHEKGHWTVSAQKTVTNTILGMSSPAAQARFRDYSQPVQNGVETVTPWVLGLALLGLSRRRPWTPGGLALLGFATVHAVVLVRLYQTAGYASHRHFMTLAVVGAAWGAAGLAWLLGRVGRRKGILIGVLLCGALLAQACQSLRDDKAYRREFGAWLALNTPPDAWIAARTLPEIAYYSGRRELDCKDVFPQYLEAADPGKQPQWLVLDRRVADDVRCLSDIQARPEFQAVPLPSKHDARFALFRRLQ